METIYKSREVNGRVVKNIPYLKHSTPCEEGCCENMITIGVGTRLKTSWLLEVYMVENNISEFDFENWNDELNNQWKAYAEIRKERVRKSFNKSVERNGEVLKRLGDEQMKLIHRYDNKSKLWFSELVNQEGTVLYKEKSSSEKEYKLDQTIKLGFKEYQIIDYDYSMYSAIRLVAKLMEVE